MDFRITNTCNSNCLYCLEQSLRTQNKFVDLHNIYELLDSERKKGGTIITFYGGNPLLHPNILDIIQYCKDVGFTSIGILTNSGSGDDILLSQLIEVGLNNVGIYFHSFQEEVHDRVVNEGIPLEQLKSNLSLLRSSNIFYKCIIHVNYQNIGFLWKDIVELHKRYECNNFEFVNYFPFDRPYEVYDQFLAYDIKNERRNIDKLFKVILKLSLSTKFVKFHKGFFGIYSDFYDFSQGILSQIGDEDTERLSEKATPFCLEEQRCSSCFIQDNCNWYGERDTG